MNVSVIIPVYKAGAFLEQAVASAIALDEVKEIILVEDGSPDDALSVCTRLAENNSKIKLFRHPDGENRGAGASRNLGLRMATAEYVAFLDADDWYLPNRFTAARKILESDSSVDGVYEATGFFYQDTGLIDPQRLTTVKKRVAPEELLHALLLKGTGSFTTDAIIFKRAVLEKSGVFDESLRLHQDTHLWLRIAYCARLMPGSIDQPVAIRRVHPDNRIARKNRDTLNMLDKKLFEWFADKPLNSRVYRILFRRYVAASRSGQAARFIFMVKFLIRKPASIQKLI